VNPTAVAEVLVHGRSRLALHHLRGGTARAAAGAEGSARGAVGAEGSARAAVGAEGSARPLLLLHGLGECSPATVPPHLASWPGPVDALDFTGHGESTRPRGGGYTAEVLMADADVALEHLGPATLLGRGLGAYVALLAAAARPDEVRGVILADGPGLVGGGVRPSSPFVPPPTVVLPGPPGGLRSGEPDPLALLELSRDVRPPDYAGEYVRLLTARSDLDRPIAVTTRVRPEWLVGVIAEGGDRIVDCTVSEALDRYATA
jgi:pimeloyl-ACP methyl ester carboxylesterase